MTEVGVFDPNTFVAGDRSTWPQPVDGIYRPEDYWTLSPGGSWDGTAVFQGDRVYPVWDGVEVGYGAGTYGGPTDPAALAAIYGSGSVDGPWTLDSVAWAIWTTAPPDWDQDARPFTGCPIGDGWRIVVEALTVDVTRSQTYGTGTYGSGTYGAGEDGWLDVTTAITACVIRRGTATEDWRIPVDAMILDVRDEDATWWRITPELVTVTPTVGTRLRVGVLSPVQTYFPLFTGTVDLIEDLHDAPPREVRVQCYGSQSDLVLNLPSYNRPNETAVARLDALFAEGGYRWASPDPAQYPDPTGPDLVNVLDDLWELRALIDRTALSAGWSFDTTARGVPRFRTWPLEAVAEGFWLLPDSPGFSSFDSGDVTVIQMGGRYQASSDGGWLNGIRLYAVAGAPDCSYDVSVVVDGVVTQLVAGWVPSPAQLGHWVELPVAATQLDPDQPFDVILTVNYTGVPGQRPLWPYRPLYWASEPVSGLYGVDVDPTGVTTTDDAYGVDIRVVNLADASGLIAVSDCPETTGVRLSEETVYVADRAALVNEVTLTQLTDLDPAPTTTFTDDASVSRFGVRTNAAGMPAPQLMAGEQDMANLATAIVARFSRITSRVESVEANTHRDPTWYTALATVDRGTPIIIERRAVDPAQFSGHVCGLEHRIEPGRWRATLYTTTTQTAL